MYKALYLSPMLPSFNIAETVSFFRELLGFEVVRDDGSYVIVHKDQHTIHILNAGTDIGQMEFYLEVDDIDQLWIAMKDYTTGLQLRGPFDREYGMRELHIAIPATNALLFIGQEMDGNL